MAERAGPPGFVRVVETIGTVFSVCVREAHLDPRLIEKIAGWWQWVDATFSPFRADSQVSRLNRQTLDPAADTEQLREVIRLCHAAKTATGGYFDAQSSGQFDPCGLVKGWSIEIASALLTAAGSANHCINGGGDVRCVGQPEPGRPWRVGIANPLQGGALAATIEVGDGAVATSGTAERGYHVLNPYTGQPASAAASVTVVGPDLTWADAYATAAFAMGYEACAWLCELADHEGLVIFADGTVEATPGLPLAEPELPGRPADAPRLLAAHDDQTRARRRLLARPGRRVRRRI
jgi:thiamine biosynthesis lipoprotein